MLNERSKSNGFSMIEGLVATSIIMIGLVAVFGLINSSLRMIAVAKDELVAANLAQEGIEIVRAIREENWIEDENFNTGLSPGQYRVHYLETRLLPFVNTPLRFDSNTGFFQYNSGEDTPFYRTISISSISPVEIRVVSQVSWQTRGLPYSVVAETHLFDWLP
ncbi:MAG: prepilin-type N-terminal cleavage/methylation domain-containing protein [Candidatus Paceibacteria bacterium]